MSSKPTSWINTYVARMTCKIYLSLLPVPEHKKWKKASVYLDKATNHVLKKINDALTHFPEGRTVTPFGTTNSPSFMSAPFEVNFGAV